MQDIWAGVQLACGGVNEAESEVYQNPPKDQCKVPGRLVISMNGGASSTTQGDIYYLKSGRSECTKHLEKQWSYQ